MLKIRMKCPSNIIVISNCNLNKNTALNNRHHVTIGNSQNIKKKTFFDITMINEIN